MGILYNFLKEFDPVATESFVELFGPGKIGDGLRGIITHPEDTDTLKSTYMSRIASDKDIIKWTDSPQYKEWKLNCQNAYMNLQDKNYIALEHEQIKRSMTINALTTIMSKLWQNCDATEQIKLSRNLSMHPVVEKFSKEYFSLPFEWRVDLVACKNVDQVEVNQHTWECFLQICRSLTGLVENIDKSNILFFDADMDDTEKTYGIYVYLMPSADFMEAATMPAIGYKEIHKF